MEFCITLRIWTVKCFLFSLLLALMNLFIMFIKMSFLRKMAITDDTMKLSFLNWFDVIFQTDFLVKKGKQMSQRFVSLMNSWKMLFKKVFMSKNRTADWTLECYLVLINYWFNTFMYFQNMLKQKAYMNKSLTTYITFVWVFMNGCNAIFQVFLAFKTDNA